MAYIEPDSVIRADNHIQETDKDATPSNDEGRVPLLEDDGKIHPFFIRNGAEINCGETLNGATTPVPVYQDKTDNELYACDANDTDKMKFIGFVVTNGTNGNPARFQGSGVVGGFSGLSEGEKYYLQDTAGTIGTSIGTYAVLVGVAISETELLIQKSRRVKHGVATLQGSSDSLAVTCGFRISLVELFGVEASTTTDSSSIYKGVYANGTLTSVYLQSDDDGGRANSDNRFYLNYDGGDYYEISITSITDTGFTISWTLTGTSVTAYLLYKAEGDL